MYTIYSVYISVINVLSNACLYMYLYILFNYIIYLCLTYFLFMWFN